MDAGYPAFTADRLVCNLAKPSLKERDEKDYRKANNVRPYVSEEVIGGVHDRAAGADATRAAHPGPHDRPRPPASSIPSSSRRPKASYSQPWPYHKTDPYTMACKALHSTSLSFKMGCWDIVAKGASD